MFLCLKKKIFKKITACQFGAITRFCDLMRAFAESVDTISGIEMKIFVQASSFCLFFLSPSHSLSTIHSKRLFI